MGALLSLGCEWLTRFYTGFDVHASGDYVCATSLSGITIFHVQTGEIRGVIPIQSYSMKLSAVILFPYAKCRRDIAASVPTIDSSGLYIAVSVSKERSHSIAVFEVATGALATHINHLPASCTDLKFLADGKCYLYEIALNEFSDNN